MVKMGIVVALLGEKKRKKLATRNFECSLIRHPEHEPDLPDSGKRIVVFGVDLKTWTGLTKNLWDWVYA